MLKNDKNKFICGFFILLLAIVAYIYISKENIKHEINYKAIENLKLNYEVYKKNYLISSKAESILIENENYVDNQELIDQFSKSTPFSFEKDDKKIEKYDITFYFYNKNKIDDKSISKKLNSHGYFIEESGKYISLFGKVFDKGYISITNYIDNRQLIDSLDTLFLEISFFILINILIFIYFIKVINDNKLLESKRIKEFEQLKDNTSKIAFEDTLTKAASRLKFDETLKDQIHISSRFEQNRFGLIMFDIDNFKKINDTYGHDYGDFVLKTVAKVIKNKIRKSDTFARWGGEEFIILSPMSTLKQTIDLAEKLRKEIFNIKFELSHIVTCSFGVVIYENNEDENDIMKRVDKLLYKAKTSGKNKVESYI